MQLVDEEKVLERLNISGSMVSTGKTNVKSAITGATTVIESLLRTSLKRRTLVDFYNYSKGSLSKFSPVPIWLSQAYVSSIVGVQVSVDGDPIISFGGTHTIEYSDYVTDMEHGRIDALAPLPQGFRTLVVKYVAGFDVSSNYDEVPDWLQEAAISAAVYLIHNQSIAHGKRDKAAMARDLARIVYQDVNEHIFTQYGGIYAATTQVV